MRPGGLEIVGTQFPVVPQLHKQGRPGANKTQAITRTNQYAIVGAGAGATLFVQLWNDGKLGAYNFQPTGAQLFVMCVPVDL